MKFRYDHRRLVKLLEFFESAPNAHSRRTSLLDVERTGYGRLPLKNPDERSFYVEQAIARGLLAEESPRAGHFMEDPSSPKRGLSIGYFLTVQGRELLANHRASRLLRVWGRQVITNIPTIVVSVLIALLSAWALEVVGPLGSIFGN